MWVDFRVRVLKQAARTYINTYYQLTSRSPADFHFSGSAGSGLISVHGVISVYRSQMEWAGALSTTYVHYMHVRTRPKHLYHDVPHHHRPSPQPGLVPSDSEPSPQPGLGPSPPGTWLGSDFFWPGPSFRPSFKPSFVPSFPKCWLPSAKTQRIYASRVDSR